MVRVYLPGKMAASTRATTKKTSGMATAKCTGLMVVCTRENGRWDSSAAKVL
jgi:hypothetical protein